MKRKNWLLFGGIALLAVAAVLMVNSAKTSRPATVPTPNVAARQAPASDNHKHSPKKVPAFQVAPARASLNPTLDPERFTGLTRDAYRAVRQIPVTIAQCPVTAIVMKALGIRVFTIVLRMTTLRIATCA